MNLNILLLNFLKCSIAEYASKLCSECAQSMFSQCLNTGGSAGGDVPIYSINSALSQILERRIVSKSHYRGSSRRSCFFPGRWPCLWRGWNVSPWTHFQYLSEKDLINCFETPTVNLYLELSVVIYFMGFKVPTSSDKLSWALMSPIWVLPSLIYLIEPYLTLIWLYRTLFGPCYI